MSLLVYVNGQLLPKDKACISVFDHGFLYGDGIFEGIRVYEGGIFKLKEHIDRLYRSAKIINLEIPLDKDNLQEDVIRTVRANGLKEGYIRLVVTRGVGDMGLDPRKCERPSIVIIVVSMPRYLGKPLRVIISSTRRMPYQCLPPHAKTLNYLNNILAKIEAISAGVDEAIMLDLNGYVAEATGENVFIVKNGVLMTPPITAPILAGITRESIIDMSKELGIPVVERQLTIDELYTADEIFLCGTASEIRPVIEVDGRIVGNGKTGPITEKLIKHFDEYIQRYLTPVYG